MNRNIIAIDNPNLYVYPPRRVDLQVNNTTQITIGDLHGNALKLIYILIQYNILNLSEDDYIELIRIYTKPVNLITKKDLIKFDQILAPNKILDIGLIRLIGDDLCDRGKNDYFTLKMIEKLRNKNIRVESLFSNHTADALVRHENRNRRYLIGIEQSDSWINFCELKKRGLITQAEFDTLMNEHYKKIVKLISYSIDESGDKTKLTIFTHAPNGLETIECLAKLYNISYDDSTTEKLCETIDEINKKFANDLEQNRLRSNYNFDYETECYPIEKEYALYRLAWNREINPLNQLKLKVDTRQGVDYTLEFVHGHAMINGKELISYYPNMTSLDNIFGKGERYSVSQDYIHFVQQIYSPRLELIKKLQAIKADLKIRNENKNPMLFRCIECLDEIIYFARFYIKNSEIMKNILMDLGNKIKIVAENDDNEKLKQLMTKFIGYIPFIPSYLQKKYKDYFSDKINAIIATNTISNSYQSIIQEQAHQTALDREYFNIAQRAYLFLLEDQNKLRRLKPADLILLEKIVKQAKQYAKNPSDLNRKECIKLANLAEGKTNWGKIMAGCVFGLIFTGLFFSAIFASIATFGIATPLSVIAFTTSTTLCAKALAISVGAASIGFQFLSAKKGLEGARHGFSAQVCRFANSH